MKSNKYISFSAPKVSPDEIEEVIDSLKSGWITTGPKTKKFEEVVKNYVGTSHALALNSCTAGLHTALVACGIGAGDEVITSPLTFTASASSIIHAGAKPVFVDVRKDSMNIDEDLIEKSVTRRTKAIIAVHLAGRPCEMDAIRRIARKYGLIVIEDAAQAIGAEYKGKKIGVGSDFTCFSFYATKNITTAEGGVVTTNRKKWDDIMRIYSLHGMSRDAWKRYSDSGYHHYDVIFPGFKYNMTDVLSALGLRQMEKIELYYKRRTDVWNAYDRAFKDLPVTLPAPCPDHMRHARHLYTLLIDPKTTGLTRDQFIASMHGKGIGTSVHFIPLHMHTYYKKAFRYKRGDFPNAEYLGERTVSLPLNASLSDADVRRIIDSVRDIISKSVRNKK